MQWSRRGAHLLLQTRTRALDGSLRAAFEHWYPSMANDNNRGHKRVAERFLSVHDQVANLFRRLVNTNAAIHRQSRAQAFRVWAEANGVAAGFRPDSLGGLWGISQLT